MKIRFLTEKEFQNSDILNFPETRPQPTNFAKTTGVANEAYYWSSVYRQNEFSDDLVYIINQTKSITTESQQNIGIRPVISLKDFQKLSISRYDKIETTADGKQIKKIIFGAFPQNKISIDSNNSFNTNEFFTFREYFDMEKHPVMASQHDTTEKYIQYAKIENKTIYNYGDGYLQNTNEAPIQQFQIQPIEWIIDEKNELLIADKILMGSNSYSDASYYLTRYFEKEITQNTDIWQNEFLLKKLGYVQSFELPHEYASIIPNPIVIRLFQEKLYTHLKTKIDIMNRIEFLQAISKIASQEPKHNQEEYNQIINYTRFLIKHTMKHPQITPKEIVSQISEEVQKFNKRKKNISRFQWKQYPEHNSRHS